MMSLADYQKTFMQAILTGDIAAQDLTAISDKKNVTERLTIYRNSVIGNRYAALEHLFPCVKKMLGAECFQDVSERFLQTHPSKEFDLEAMGVDFAPYLKTINVLESVPFVSDLAMFEWHWYQVFHGPNNRAIHFETFNQLNLAERNALKLELMPGMRIMLSSFPLLALWEMCQPEYTGDFSVPEDNRAVAYALTQREDSIFCEPLEQEPYEVLSILNKNQSIYEICLSYEKQSQRPIDSWLIPSLYSRGLVSIVA